MLKGFYIIHKNEKREVKLLKNILKFVKIGILVNLIWLKFGLIFLNDSVKLPLVRCD